MPVNSLPATPSASTSLLRITSPEPLPRSDSSVEAEPLPNEISRAETNGFSLSIVASGMSTSVRK